MIPNWPRKSGSYEIVGVPGIFSATPDGIEVSTHAFHAVLEPYENSWGTTVT